MKKIILIIKDIVFWFIAVFDILWLIAFHIIYIFLKSDYGKTPDNSINVTKSKFYYWIDFLRDLNGHKIINYLTFLFLLAIVLKVFKINLVTKKQIFIFLFGVILLFLVMAIDPLGAFEWYFN